MDSATVRSKEGVAPSRRRFALASPEDIAWLGLVPLTLVLLASALWLAPSLSHLHPGPTEQVFPEWRLLLKPEPLEATRYLIAAVGPVILAALVLAVGTRHPGRRSADGLVIAIQLTGAGFLAWSVAHQIHLVPITSPSYFDPLLLSVPNVIAGLVIGTALTALAYAGPELRPAGLRRAVDWLARRSWLAVAIAVALTAIWLLPALVTDVTVRHAGPVAGGHIPAQAEDYFSVANGRTPLVDYIPIYASLLPLALEPVLRTFDLSLTAFSISMCALSLVGLLTVFGAFHVITRRLWVALALYLPFVAISLFPWDRDGAQWDYNGNYYGFFPGRYLGPFLVMWLCALSLRGRRVPPWAVFFAAGLTAANNAEFGVPCLMAAAVALAFGADRSLPVRARASALAVSAAAGIGGALALVCGVILVRSGELPSPSFATYWSSTFARDGYGLEPMPTLGLHWAIYLTYAAALLSAAVRYVRRDPDRVLTGMLAFSGILGLLTGFYFAGRSVPWQLMLLFPIWAFALSLLTFMVVGSLRRARGDSLRLRRLALPAVATLTGFGVMIAALVRFPAPWDQVDRLMVGGRAVYDQPAAQRFVETHTTAGEHVLIMGTPVDHRIAARAGVVNTSPFFSVLGLLSERDAERAINLLEDDGGRIVLERVSDSIPQLARILRQRGFERVEKDPASGLVEWERK
jgi:hypothetical protein